LFRPVTDPFDSLLSRLDQCLLSDRERLRKRLHGLRRRAAEAAPFDEGLARVQAAIAASLAKAEARRATLPEPAFPPELPVSERLAEIQALLRNHQVVVLCGETGSGKSTQLPKICLSLGRGVFGRIGHTQPRRIAARSLASRIASELGQQVGESVGYKVRFADRVGEHTQVKLMTDGMLLAEIQQDRLLTEYDTLIIDEAHERSLNIDFLLGYLKQLLPRRPDLKVIITSATIDPEKFAKHFDGAPIINVSGRTYPVEVRYRPPEEEAGAERDDAMQQAIVDAVDELSRIDRGDVLVFLSGEREIRETAETLRKHKLQVTEVLPLYARQSAAEQSRIFKPSGQRRIILATNVAETSLTVPGIRYVIDAGYARISRYSARSKIQRLPVERVSQASAEQRKGRCGRVAAGVCIRLYAEEDFASRAQFTEPEIQRTNLAAVILQMQLLGFGDIHKFPFVDPPDARLIKDGYRVLAEIGAVDGLRKVTNLGKKIARLPVDPRIGRMLLEAAHTHCLREMLVIASALSVQDPRDRPLDKQQAADEAHALFKDEQSDFVSYLKLWDFLEEKRPHLTHRKFRELCKSHFLSFTRVQEWRDIHQQLRVQLHEQGYRDNQVDPGYETLHRAILSGLLSHVGFRPSGKDREYQGARGSKFFVFPGSGLFGKQPKWLVAAELVETTKLYARGCALVQPEWVESLAGHLIKRSYSEPHWQAKRGQVGAYEKVTLYGLPLVPRRRINYGPIDPQTSRDIFIRFALVEGDFHTRAPFWRHNRELIEAVHDMEARSRRRDILVDEEVIYQYYAERVPEGIYSKAQFEEWLRQATRSHPKLLHMRMEHLLRPGAAGVEQAQFPEVLDIDGMALPLEYHFQPGSEADGVTLVCPAAVLNQVTEARADWLVPGLLRDKVITLIKGLPKALRRNFVPVPDFADRAMAGLAPSDTPLVQALGAALKQLTGVHIPEDAWGTASLPDFMRLRLRVVDAQGNTLGAARDVPALQKAHAGLGGELAAHALPSTGLEREGLQDWDCGDLPGSVDTEGGGIRLRGFPALVDEGDSVAVRIIDSAPNAAVAHHAGLRRLIMLKVAKEIRYLRKNLPNLAQMRLQYAKAAAGDPRAGDLADQLVALIVDLTFLVDRPEIRTRIAFQDRVAHCQGQLMTQANAACKLVAEVLASYQQVRKRLGGITQINWLASLNDMREQLDGLVYQGFLQQVPYGQLAHYPRYLKALASRIDKLAHAAVRDQQQLEQLRPLYEHWLQRQRQVAAKGQADPRLEEIRWMLEEWRVSLFAQELKTAYPVSAKRIDKRWRELGL
jgi:ATP-dependent helicase HrpA